MAEIERKKKQNGVIVLVALVAVLVGVLVYVGIRMHNAEKQTQAVAEEMAYEKEQLQNDYQDLASEMDGFSFKTNNDSLLNKIDEEKQHVQLLLEELKTVKATDAKKILALRKELNSVRQVLRYYVAQVDSLNTVNTQLKTENRQVHAKYRVATQTVDSLSAQKEKLEETVSLASQLNATGINVTTLNKRGRTAHWITQIAKIKVTFTIVKNITATVGTKTIYLRLVSPTGNVLTDNPDNVFPYEDQNIAYSSKRDFDFGGEQVTETVYWTVVDTLIKGTYRADIFVDGNLIGSQFFTIK